MRLVRSGQHHAFGSVQSAHSAVQSRRRRKEEKLIANCSILGRCRWKHYIDFAVLRQLVISEFLRRLILKLK
jgi:hypothetical protein